jgi:hypothetical protein
MFTNVKRNILDTYKEPCIISGIDAAICWKLTVGLVATIILEEVTILSTLPFFKCILEVVFCEGV